MKKLFLCLSLAASCSQAVAKDLHDVPFWNSNEGLWVSENTYLAPGYEHRIKRYHSLLDISIEGTSVTLTETKFYPPGAFNGAYLGLDINPNYGVEYLQISKGKLRKGSDIVDMALQGSAADVRSKITVIDDKSAMMTVNHSNISAVNDYQMHITLPTEHFRYVTSIGLNSESKEEAVGSLRGLSFFAGSRISESARATEISRLRKIHTVGTKVRFWNNTYVQEPVSR